MTESRQSPDRRELPGSHREPVGKVVGAVPDDHRAQVTLVLRRAGEEPQPGQRLTPADLAASPDDLALVHRVLDEHGIRVVEEHPESRRVRVEGTVGALNTLFGTQLQQVTRDDDHPQARMRSGSLSLPADLADVVVAVLGLDDRPQAAARSVVAKPHAGQVSYTPLDLATVYGMPAADGTGQTIAIIELGGGFAQADLDHYFQGLGLTSPKVGAVGVDGATNKPGQDPQGADGEVLLDIEVAGAIAPKADILVYFAPNSDAGFLDAIATAAHAKPTPAAISISWGQSEDQWTAQARTAMDSAIADATALGATVTVAAGDNGSGDNDPSAGAHTDFPASSPHSLACGGTTLHASGGSVQSETVWGGTAGDGSTGGGVSDAFPLPAWQASAGVPERAGATTSGRGVPDVAGNADPATGYQVYVDGSAMVIGGTSAVAPLWAGLIARLAQLHGSSLGLLQPTLYQGSSPGKASASLRDITSGSNGAYSAGPGWDACTGLGVPEAALAGLWPKA